MWQWEAAVYLVASVRQHEGHVHLAVRPQQFGSRGLVHIVSHVCFWVGRLPHSGALSFAFYPETTQTWVAHGCRNLSEHGSAYLSSWLQCGVGLTQESH